MYKVRREEYQVGKRRKVDREAMSPLPFNITKGEVDSRQKYSHLYFFFQSTPNNRGYSIFILKRGKMGDIFTLLRDINIILEKQEVLYFRGRG